MQNRLAIEHFRGTWFGSLSDERDSLIAAALGPDPEKVQNHLDAYSVEKCGVTPIITKMGFTDEMIDIFAGDPVPASTSFNTSYITPFQRRVIRVLERIPRGKVTTYGLIAKHLPSGPRAVGGAVASNPWPLFVPCHRVVNWDLTIGNYSLCGRLGSVGTVVKRALLAREQAPLRGDRIELTGLWNPSENAD